MFFHIYFDALTKKYDYVVMSECKVGQYVDGDYFFAVFMRGIDCERYLASQNGAK